MLSNATNQPKLTVKLFKGLLFVSLQRSFLHAHNKKNKSYVWPTGHYHQWLFIFTSVTNDLSSKVLKKITQMHCFLSLDQYGWLMQYERFFLVKASW